MANSKTDASQFLLLSAVGHFSLLPLVFTSAGNNCLVLSIRLSVALQTCCVSIRDVNEAVEK